MVKKTSLVRVEILKEIGMSGGISGMEVYISVTFNPEVLYLNLLRINSDIVRKGRYVVFCFCCFFFVPSNLSLTSLLSQPFPPRHRSCPQSLLTVSLSFWSLGLVGGPVRV